MKALTAAFALALSLLTSLSLAAEVPFNQAQFASMRDAGKPVAVVFHADWCPTCKAQAPVLQQLMHSPEFQKLTLFVADFDTEKALKRALHVSQQSTVVVFKDGKESGRSTGDTQADNLAAVLRRAT